MGISISLIKTGQFSVKNCIHRIENIVILFYESEAIILEIFSLYARFVIQF